MGETEEQTEAKGKAGRSRRSAGTVDGTVLSDGSTQELSEHWLGYTTIANRNPGTCPEILSKSVQGRGCLRADTEGKLIFTGTRHMKGFSWLTLSPASLHLRHGEGMEDSRPLSSSLFCKWQNKDVTWAASSKDSL